MDYFDFTEEEIREQLEKLGYFDLTRDRLLEFKKDLERLILHEKSKDSTTSSQSTAQNGSITESDVNQDGKPNEGHLYQPAPSRPPYQPLSHGQKSGPAILIPTSHLTGQDDSSESDEIERYVGIPEARADTSIASSNSERRFIKRRVARKVDGHSMVSDELTESELGDVSSLEERLGHLDLESGAPLCVNGASRVVKLTSASQRTNWPQRPHTADAAKPSTACNIKRPRSAEPVFRLPDDYDGPTALIKTMKGNPHMKNIRRSDPVSRYQQYSQCWQTQRAPGEKNHSHLRWNVREQMLYHDEVIQRKPKKVYVPNKYVIPSDKKRKNLRWAIRQDMAQGLVPPSVFDYM